MPYADLLTGHYPVQQDGNGANLVDPLVKDVDDVQTVIFLLA